MSEAHYCDLCESVIKPKERIFLTTTLEKEYSKIKTSEDYTRQYQNALENTKEICKTCYNLLINIFKLRYDSINKIAKDLSRSYNDII